MNDLIISEGTRVTLNFALILEDGSEVDNNFDGAPASLFRWRWFPATRL